MQRPKQNLFHQILPVSSLGNKNCSRMRADLLPNFPNHLPEGQKELRRSSHTHAGVWDEELGLVSSAFGPKHFGEPLISPRPFWQVVGKRAKPSHGAVLQSPRTLPPWGQRALHCTTVHRWDWSWVEFTKQSWVNRLKKIGMNRKRLYQEDHRENAEEMSYRAGEGCYFMLAAL